MPTENQQFLPKKEGRKAFFKPATPWRVFLFHTFFRFLASEKLRHPVYFRRVDRSKGVPFERKSAWTCALGQQTPKGRTVTRQRPRR